MLVRQAVQFCAFKDSIFLSISMWWLDFCVSMDFKLFLQHISCFCYFFSVLNNRGFLSQWMNPNGVCNCGSRTAAVERFEAEAKRWSAGDTWKLQKSFDRSQWITITNALMWIASLPTDDDDVRAVIIKNDTSNSREREKKSFIQQYAGNELLLKKRHFSSFFMEFCVFRLVEEAKPESDRAVLGMKKINISVPNGRIAACSRAALQLDVHLLFTVEHMKIMLIRCARWWQWDFIFYMQARGRREETK